MKKKRRKRETLTMLRCGYCELTTGHRVVNKEEYPDRVVVLFACTLCEAEQHKERDIPPKKKREMYWIEMTNSDDVYFKGKQGYGIVHKDKDCQPHLRPSFECRVGETTTWKIGRGAWIDVYIESRCEKCFKEETDE